MLPERHHSYAMIVVAKVPPWPLSSRQTNMRTLCCYRSRGRGGGGGGGRRGGGGGRGGGGKNCSVTSRTPIEGASTNAGPSITVPRLAKFLDVFRLSRPARTLSELEPSAYMTRYATLPNLCQWCLAVGSASLPRIFPCHDIQSAPCTQVICGPSDSPKV